MKAGVAFDEMSLDALYREQMIADRAAILSRNPEAKFMSGAEMPAPKSISGANPEELLISMGVSRKEAKLILSGTSYEEQTRIVETMIKEKEISNIRSTVYSITSAVKTDSVLLKEAGKLGADDSKDINNMLDVLIRGGNPGIGSHPLGGNLKNIIEARARNGARIYHTINEKDRSIKILAYSTKANQGKVIGRLESLYGK